LGTGKLFLMGGKDRKRPDFVRMRDFFWQGSDRGTAEKKSEVGNQKGKLSPHNTEKKAIWRAKDLLLERGDESPDTNPQNCDH